MRWLLGKDLRILWRSPLLVGLLVAYPLAVAALVGLALSRAPDEPRVALLNQVPEAANEIAVGGERIDASRYADTLGEAVDLVPVESREEALAAVRDGDVLAALVIPPDTTQKLEQGLEPATIEVLYNAEDPAKRAFVESTIEAQVAEANAALTERFSNVAVDYVDLIVTGGQIPFLGQTLDILGLERAERILDRARAELPPGTDARRGIERVAAFARLARQNLALSDDVLRSVGRPLQVEPTVVEGGTTPLSAFAAAVAVGVSLMFVALLLAAGVLALEREDDALARLLRGPVAPAVLLAEKIALAAGCGLAVAAAMLAGLAPFVHLDPGRVPLWLAAAAGGALAFAAMGVAVGAVAREVRTASLLAFMLSLPIAFLALVPSGSVSSGVFDITRAVSALFPFEPTLAALDAALNGVGSLIGPLLHLAGLTLVFAALARFALRRGA